MVATHAERETSKDSRAVILTVALDLFSTKGYDATSIDDIRQAAGFKSKASLYTHFKSKEEVAQALLRQCNADEEQVVAAAYDAAEADVLVRFAQVGRAFSAWALTHPNAYTFRFLRVQQEKVMRGRYSYLDDSAGSPSYPLLLALIAEMRAKWPVRAIADAALLSMMVGLISKAVIDQDAFGPITLAERVAQLMEMSAGILFAAPVAFPTA